MMDPAFDVPTVTDANLVLGRLVPGLFLGGAMPLYPDRSLNALTRLGNQLGLDPYTLALGIIEVACAHMERAIRLISVERGYDTREFTLLSFGGAGGLHAVDLARRCGIPQVVVPPNASTLSALGMLAADLVKDYSQTVMLSSAEGYRALELRLQPMLERGRQELLAESVPCEKIRLEPALDMRLRGQSYELTVPFQVDYLQRFHQIHDRLYGYSRPEAEVEVVTLRVRAVGEVDPPVFPDLPLEGEDPCAASLDFQRVGMDVDGRFTWQKIPFYRFELLRPGNRVSGPAVIARHDTTVWLGTGDQGRLDGFGNLWIALQGERVDPWK
jgi:N-methylhydantoinase A